MNDSSTPALGLAEVVWDGSMKNLCAQSDQGMMGVPPGTPYESRATWEEVEEATLPMDPGVVRRVLEDTISVGSTVMPTADTSSEVTGTGTGTTVTSDNHGYLPKTQRVMPTSDTSSEVMTSDTHRYPPSNPPEPPVMLPRVVDTPRTHARRVMRFQTMPDHTTHQPPKPHRHTVKPRIEEVKVEVKIEAKPPPSPTTLLPQPMYEGSMSPHVNLGGVVGGDERVLGLSRAVGLLEKEMRELKIGLRSISVVLSEAVESQLAYHRENGSYDGSDAAVCHQTLGLLQRDLFVEKQAGLQALFRLPDEILTSKFTPEDLRADLKIIQLRFEDWKVVLDRAVGGFERLEDDVWALERGKGDGYTTAGDRKDFNRVKGRMKLVKQQLDEMQGVNCPNEHKLSPLFERSAETVFMPSSVVSTAPPSTLPPPSPPPQLPSFIDNASPPTDRYTTIFKGMYSPTPHTMPTSPCNPYKEIFSTRRVDRPSTEVKKSPKKIFPPGRCVLHTPSIPVVRYIRSNKGTVELLSLSREVTDVIVVKDVLRAGCHPTMAGGMEVVVKSRYQPNETVTYVLEMDRGERDTWLRWMGV